MNKRSHIAPALIYLTGLGALLLSDILVTKFLSARSVATWAEIRSLVGITSVLCLVGLDQVFMRSPQSSARLLKILALQIPVLAALLAGVSYVLKINQNWIAVMALSVGAAGSLALFQFYRSHNRKSSSQFAQQSWRIFGLGVILYSIVFDLSLELTSALAATMLLAFFVSLIPAAFFRMPSEEPEKMGLIYRIGVRFLITSALLSLAIYAEQLVVSSLGTAEESAYYFTHATYFLFPISLLNGYFAFNIGPWIRGHRAAFVRITEKKMLMVVFAAVSYSVVVHIVGWGSWLILDPGNKSPEMALQIFFLGSCIMRTLYMLPAGYMGVFGVPSQHDQLIKLQVAALATSIALFLVMFLSLDFPVAHATVVASFVNWLLRTLAGFRMIRSIETSQLVSL